MATTNFDKFKQLMEQKAAAKAPKKTGPNWFKAEKGVSYNFRFLPLKSQNMELPIEFYHHHAINFPDGRFESFACRQRKGEGDCPFCKLANETYKKFLATDNEDYKNAFKQIVAKTHYLLVGYEPTKIDKDNISESDLKVVRASSKATMEKIETQLSKGKDFVDFTEGRNWELKKPEGKGDVIAVNWDIDDTSVAFPGKDGKKVWEQLLDVSPDLSKLVESPSDEKLAELMTRFAQAPVIAEPTTKTSALADTSKSKVAKAEAVEANEDIDIEALRRQLEAD
jgi:hypothetical protein